MWNNVSTSMKKGFASEPIYNKKIIEYQSKILR